MAVPPISEFEKKTIAELTRAIYHGETAKALTLIRPGLPFEHVARDVSHTPLVAAIENGNMPVFEAMLAAGASVGAGERSDVSVPLFVATSAANHAGWIEFGEPLPEFRCKKKPELRLVRPEAGMMLLFPSYFHHRTLPFRAGETRISIAFDVVPTA